MKMKRVLTGVLSIGIALSLAACSGETDDEENMMETPPPETETTPNTGETDPGVNTELEDEEPGTDPSDAEDPNAEMDEEVENQDPALNAEEPADTEE